MYTSLQRNLMDNNDLYISTFGTESYCEVISRIICVLKRNQDFVTYLRKRKIPINDFVILSALQHYKIPTPFLDFTSDILTALFFAQDKTKPQYGDSLDCYVSIYVIKKSELNSYSWQKMMQNDVSRAQDLAKEHEKRTGEQINTEKFKTDIKDSTYAQFGKEIKYLFVEGPDIGITTINAPYLGLNCEYNITNKRIEQQSGCFILNNDQTKPLEDLVTENTGFDIQCYDISKTLLCEIEQLLEKQNICADAIYCRKDMDSQKLQQIITEGYLGSLFTT